MHPEDERHAATPDPPEAPGDEDATLGGYLKVHSRPPAFEGADDHPYTVSIEIERTGNLIRPFVGFLMFPRWAKTGLGIVGHVETPVLWEGAARSAVEEEAGLISLFRVKQLLDEALLRQEGGSD